MADNMKSLELDNQTIINSMIEEGLLPTHLEISEAFTLDDRERFYEDLTKGRLAKAAIFARQDAGITLRTVVRHGSEFSYQLTFIRGLLWTVVVSMVGKLPIWHFHHCRGLELHHATYPDCP